MAELRDRARTSLEKADAEKRASQEQLAAAQEMATAQADRAS